MSVMRSSFNALADTLGTTHGESAQYVVVGSDKQPVATYDLDGVAVTQLRTSDQMEQDGRSQQEALVATFERLHVPSVALRDQFVWNGFTWIVDETQTTNAKHEITCVRIKRTLVTGDSDAMHNRQNVDRSSGLGG